MISTARPSARDPRGFNRRMTMPTIGIPRSLMYHKHQVLWSEFFGALGCPTVVSPPTNKRILERGTELAVDESCLPLKVFLGHVENLKDRCDYVLVPRMESVQPKEHVCVKLMGCYDIVRNTMPEVPVLIYDVDVTAGRSEGAEMEALARRLGAGKREAREAYRHAKAAEGRALAEREAAQSEMVETAGRLRVLVVGHAYNLGDAMIGEPILEFLKAQDVDVLVSEDVDHAEARALSPALSPTIRWTFNKELLGAVQMYRDRIDGIVFIVTFPCGPDSLMAELCQRRLGDIPVATLVLDELQGEGGLRTRLESFVDILRMRKAC